MTEVQIYTDGSARKPGRSRRLRRSNALYRPDRKALRKTMSGGYVRTTNNRMELMAAIAGLEALNRPCAVSLYSDSKYLTDAFNKHWIEGWVAKTGIGERAGR